MYPASLARPSPGPASPLAAPSRAAEARLQEIKNEALGQVAVLPLGKRGSELQ